MGRSEADHDGSVGDSPDGTMTDRPTALVVDDSVSLAALYATWLTVDCRVRLAHDGESALSSYDAAVDVAVLDRHLPDVHGDVVAETLREKDADVPILFVSAVDAAKRPSVDHEEYLVKPVDRAALVEAVRSALD